MASTTVCDGNGSTIPPDTPVSGPCGHQYCDELRPTAEAYMADLNALHTEMATSFKLRMEELRSLYREKLNELPDTP